MIAENPSPDNDTMETLIETNEELSKSLNQYQRALLAARKALGQGTSRGNSPAGSTQEQHAPPPGPPPSKATATPAIPPRKVQQPTGISGTSGGPLEENPFLDPQHEADAAEPSLPFPKDSEPKATGQFNDSHGVEPYHPGGFSEGQKSEGDNEQEVEEHSEIYENEAAPKTPMYRY